MILNKFETNITDPSIECPSMDGLNRCLDVGMLGQGICFYYKLQVQHNPNIRDNRNLPIAHGAYSTEEEATQVKNGVVQTYTEQNNLAEVNLWNNKQVYPLKKNDVYIRGTFGGTVETHGVNDGLMPAFE